MLCQVFCFDDFFVDTIIKVCSVYITTYLLEQDRFIYGNIIRWKK